MKFSLSRWLPVLLWAVVIFIASARSNPYQALPAGWAEPVSPSTMGSSARDELLGRFLHAGEYVVLAALTARALVWRSKLRFSLLAAALGLAALYALSDETHQLFVPGTVVRAARPGAGYHRRRGRAGGVRTHPPLLADTRGQSYTWVIATASPGAVFLGAGKSQVILADGFYDLKPIQLFSHIANYPKSIEL